MKFGWYTWFDQLITKLKCQCGRVIFTKKTEGTNRLGLSTGTLMTKKEQENMQSITKTKQKIENRQMLTAIKRIIVDA